MRSLAAAGEGFVLPRILRRPARAVSRALAEGVEPPRFAALSLTAALFAATAAYGVVLGGHGAAIVKTVTSSSGFAVDRIVVTGHRETSEIDVLQEIGLDGSTSLVGFDAGAARERIQSLPWVSSATVRKIYPDRVDVAIVEKEPFAIWQHGGELTLIEQGGAAIAPFRSERYAALPLVVGFGADTGAPEIVRLVEDHPGLASRIRGFVRVSDRRWNLRLENGVTVKLPETGIAAALGDLVALDDAGGLLSRDIVAIDMRLPDRLVVKLTPEAVVRRDAAIKEDVKRRKAAERRA